MNILPEWNWFVCQGLTVRFFIVVTNHLLDFDVVRCDFISFISNCPHVRLFSLLISLIKDLPIFFILSENKFFDLLTLPIFVSLSFIIFQSDLYDFPPYIWFGFGVLLFFEYLELIVGLFT